jgi:hypothetical protein
VAAVQDVETAVGEADLQPLTAPGLDLTGQFVDRGDLGVGQGGVLAHLGLDQFGRGDHGGAALSDHHARGEDGQLDRLLQGRARAERQTERRQTGVAGAGDVEHLARPAGEMLDRAVPAGQTHPLARAGDDDSFRRRDGQQMASAASTSASVPTGIPVAPASSEALGLITSTAP